MNLEKFQNLTRHSCCSMLTPGKKLKARRGDEYHFVHKGDMFPYRNHEASCEKLWFATSLYPNLPQMGHFFTMSFSCHSMIACQVS